MTRICAAWFAVFFLFSAHASADSVTLKNGDRVSGKVIEQSAESIAIETPYAGTLRIPRSAVAKVAIEQAAAKPPPPPVVYKGRVNLSGSRVSGNSSSSRGYAEAEFGARAKAYRYRLQGRANRASEAGRKVASNWLAQGNFDRFIGAKDFWYVRGALEHDRFKDLDQRRAVGAGYGFQFLEDETTRLALRGGLDLVSVDHIAAADRSYPAAGWGVEFSHKLWGGRTELFHDQEGYWNLEDTRQVSLRSRTGVRMPLGQGLSANAQLNLDWERRPAAGRKSTDATWLVGLGYEW